MRKDILGKLVAFAGVVAISGCLGSAPKGSSGGSGSTGSGGSNAGSAGSGGSGGGSSSGGTTSGGGTAVADGGTAAPAAPDPNLAARAVNYGAALRTAAIKLVGQLPTLDEMSAVKDATTYAAQLDTYMADPRFTRQIKIYFSDMMKMGGMLPVVNGKTTTNVSLDTAPTFAAELVVNDLPITNLFTATTNTCPTVDATGKFTDAACPVANGLTTSGILTDPGAMAQFYSNMAFRRVRWIQETFDCLKFPTEFSAKPAMMGNGLYTSPWPFTSVPGGTTALVNFQDTSSIICANCHTTMNHIAPLFANFDVLGAYQTSIQVHTPVLNTPLTTMADWLPSGETLSWRYGTNITTITDLGTAMAADAAVQKCQVQRAWNWAMNKTDIVNDLAIVPDTTITDTMTAFTTSGFKMKATLKAIFTSPDYVSF